MSESPLIPPQNLDAERQILGAVMLDNKAISRIADLLPSDFYREANGTVYKKMLDLSAKREPIDIVTLKGVAEPGYVASILTETVTSANIAYHAKMVKDLSRRRQLLRLCLDIQNGIHERSLDESLSEVRKVTQSLVSGHGGKIKSMKDVAKDLYGFIESRYEKRGAMSGVPSGFRDIDTITDGFQGGDFIVLAARPSKGKSALAMAFAQNAGIPVGVISLEMGPQQIGIRTLSSLSQVELFKLRKGYFSKSDWSSVTNSVATMAEMPIYLSFSSRNAGDIEKIVTQMIEEYGIKMLIIDYLQLVKSENSKKREQEVAEVSRLCKALALTHNIPVLALAQLNRDSEKEKRKPNLADLRESGQIEQDADVVMFIYEKQGRRGQTDDGVIDIIFAKGRNIGLGEIRLVFDRDTMTFRDYDHHEG